MDYDPWGRDTPFYTDKGLKSWKMYRSWGTSWREVDLTKACTSTWCGAPPNSPNNKYSFAFRKDRDYVIKIVALKEDPTETIKWGFGPVDPFWYGIDDVDYSQNVSELYLELGSQINLSMNLTGANLTVEINASTNVSLNLSVLVYWDLNETSGTNVKDSVAGEVNGTTNNMDGSEWISGKIGNGLNFTGTDYVTIGNRDKFYCLDACSINVWAKPYDYSDGTPDNLLNFWDTSTEGWMIQGKNSQILATLGNGTITYSEHITERWFMITFTYNGTDSELYINGTSVGTHNAPTITARAGNNLSFGTSISAGPGEYYAGELDEPSFYNLTLNTTSILSLYNDYRANTYPFQIEANTTTNETTSNVTAVNICVDIDHFAYGDNYTCGTSVNFLFNISYFRNNQFNDSSTSKEIGFNGPENYTYYIRSHQYSEFINFSLNLTGTESNKTFPDIKIYINNSFSNDLGKIGALISLDHFDDFTISKNLTFVQSGSQTANINLPVTAIINTTQINITGLDSITKINNTNGLFVYYSFEDEVNGEGNLSLNLNPAGIAQATKFANDTIHAFNQSGNISYPSHYFFINSSTFFNFGDGKNFTITGWLKPVDLGPSFILRKHEESGEESGWGVHIDSSGKICYNIGDPTEQSICTDETLEKNVWGYFAVINNDTDTCIKINFNSPDCIGSITPADDIRYVNIGFSGGGVDNYEGLIDDLYFFDEALNETETNQIFSSFPENPYMWVGVVNGSFVWNYTGSFNVSEIANNFSNEIKSYLNNCTAVSGYCDVPITFSTIFGGKFELNQLEINYSYDPNPLYLDLDLISDFFGNSSGFADLPITISGEQNGTLVIDDLRFDYAGGNDTIEVFIYEDGNTTNNDTLNLVNYYSNWNYVFPNYIDWLEFIPRSATAKNVTPYGQTNSKPILNITNYGYGGRESNFSVYLNESFACVNLTLSIINNKSGGFILNNTWRDFLTNFDYQESNGLWIWADYNCNYTTWKLWEPGIFFRNCCEDCVCSEDLD